MGVPQIAVMENGNWVSGSKLVALPGQRILTREEQKKWHAENPDAFPGLHTMVNSADGMSVLVDVVPRELMTEEEVKDLDARVAKQKKDKAPKRKKGKA